jgi:catechol 2,3-dioxygenase-like lactoylglutathione lyase family enzyme
MMQIRRFNRVELLVAEDDIEAAVEKFNDLLGFHLSPPDPVPGQKVRSSTDYEAGIEFFAPSGPDSPLVERLAQKGRGAIGPLVWEVDDIDEAKEWALSKGINIVFEFESETGIRQLHFDPEQFFGYGVTLTQLPAQHRS